MHAVVPRKLWYARPRHGWTDQLYGTKGAWKSSPTCYALLNVDFVAILRRTHIYILIWACNPASPNSTTVILQNCSSFKTKPTKNKSVVLFPAMLRSKRYLLSCMVGLTRLTTPRGWSAIRNTDPVGVKGWKVKGSLKGAWSQKSRCQRLLKFSKSWGLRVRGIQGQWWGFKVLGGHPSWT